MPRAYVPLKRETMKTMIGAVAVMLLALAGCGGAEPEVKTGLEVKTPDFTVTPSGLVCPNADHVSDRIVVLPSGHPANVRSCVWDCATYSVWTRVRLTVLAVDGATEPVFQAQDNGC